MKSLKVKMFVLGVLLAVSGFFATSAAVVVAVKCVPKTCTVDGQQGVCCLRGSGSIECEPCGGFEPSDVQQQAQQQTTN